MDKLTSRKNPISIHLKKLGASREYRHEHGQFLCDGIKLLEDAAGSGAEIITVLSSAPLPLKLPAGATLFEAPRDLIDSLSPLKNAQELLFSCKTPRWEKADFLSGTHILLDGLQDPGNLGTIIRTANALGIKSVILTGDCADPFNPKTVRASMGAVFRQPVTFLEPAGLEALVRNGARLIGAALGADDISTACLKNSILAVGNEGRGLSAEVLSLCRETVTIPIAPECESLNAAVAAALLMWEAVK